jgi:FKBP-type peptidyl-prolyl cis-trans isomerase
MKSVLSFIAATALVPAAATSVLLAQAPAAAQAAAAELPAMTTTASGLKYAITVKGTGAVPRPGQVIITHYVGMLEDGTRFDSSRDRGEPFAFTLGEGRVIKGWDEGFGLLHVGDHAIFIVPPELAYGARKIGPIPANATLRFDVELIDVKDRALSNALQAALDSGGTEAAQRRFIELKETKFDGLHVSEDQINGLGYARLRAGRTEEAVAVFKWNAELYPGSANVHDSLGEAYAKNGEPELAIKSYERSLAINPKNTNAQKALTGLRSGL